MNDTDRVILTDADGVLLNWEYAFKVWMANKGYPIVNPHLKYEYGIQYLYDLSNDVKESLIREFNASAAMGFLPPLRDSIQYVQKLHREEGYVFHCITAMSNDKHAQKLRKDNLRKIYGKTVFEEFLFLDCGADKDKVLSQYKNSGLLWIEDKLENAVEGKRQGLDSVLMEHSHNMIRSNVSRDDPIWKEAMDIPRFQKWKGIYNYVVGE